MNVAECMLLSRHGQTHWYTGVFAQKRDLCYSDLWARGWFSCCLFAVGDRPVLTLLSTPSSISKGSYFFLQHMAPLYAFCHKLIQAAEEMHYTISLCSKIHTGLLYVCVQSPVAVPAIHSAGLAKPAVVGTSSAQISSPQTGHRWLRQTALCTAIQHLWSRPAQLMAHLICHRDALLLLDPAVLMAKTSLVRNACQ